MLFLLGSTGAQMGQSDSKSGNKVGMVMGLGFLFLVIFLILFQLYKNYSRVRSIFNLSSSKYSLYLLDINECLNCMTALCNTHYIYLKKLIQSYSSSLHLFLLAEEEDLSLPSDGNYCA